MKPTRQLTTNSSTFDLLLILALIIFGLALVGCAGVNRPDAQLCGINAKSSSLRCYNLKSDFNSDGSMKPGAKPVKKPIKSLMDLNAGVYMSPADFEKVKVWIQDLRDAYESERKLHARMAEKPLLKTLHEETNACGADQD